MEKNTLESALKEFSQTSGTNANDVKEFFALMSDGSIKRMPKEDMATVLGGLMDISSALMNKGTIGPNDDLNTIDIGIYYYYVENGYPANLPSDKTGINRGDILSLSTSQFIIGFDSSIGVTMRIRSKVGNSWGAWKKASLSY